MTSMADQLQDFITGAKTCPIWGTECQEKIQDANSITVVASPRAGGDYVIERSVFPELRQMYAANPGNEFADMLRTRLTAILVRQRQLGNDLPRITERSIDTARSSRPARMEERLTNLLQFLIDRTPKAGMPLGIGPNPSQLPNIGDPAEKAANWQNAQYGLACSECADLDELNYLANSLAERGLIEKGSEIGDFLGDSFGFLCRVTANGYIAIEERQTEVRSDQCFVAMWFNEATVALYDRAIVAAVKAAGYEPLRIDRSPDFLGKIDDQIIAEIRRSRFVIADFTHGDDGSRGSVYYEVGFAQGLDLPVIFTCRADQIRKLAFDTNHFLHLDWRADAPEALIERLKNRILANIGEGRTPSAGSESAITATMASLIDPDRPLSRHE